MPIIVRFSYKDDWPAVFYACLIAILSFIQATHISILEKAQKSVFMFQMPNITSIQPHLYCGISYGHCHCSIVSVKHCLTDEQLKIGRILPLASFVLQVYLIREILSLTRGYTLALIFSTWITILLIFIGILCRLSIYLFLFANSYDSWPYGLLSIYVRSFCICL